MRMRNISIILLCTLFVTAWSCRNRYNKEAAEVKYSGSESCITCHEKFYKLWSPSHHGKAMQPVTFKMIKEDSLTTSENFSIEGKNYQVEVRDSSVFFIEKSADLTNRFRVDWALGGKNVFYFLIPLEKGKLQTIPLAYDVRVKKWYNNPQSAVRHFTTGNQDQALPWKDRMYTFNTSCYSCHVSQLKTNYDLSNDSYQTIWREPGINCETCHGPSSGHVAVCTKAGKDEVPEDLKIISTKRFNPEQHNTSCGSCHAKMQPITPGFLPGEKFFDHFNLTTLENPDFYPDGRDLGENYTYTGWLMSKCIKTGELHCVKCHTSSGRNKFRDNPNAACLPCHEWNVNNVVNHSRHQANSTGALCVNCHMPKTEFGRMVRSDHSMRPPMPAATISFGSPNACNICHKDKTPQWANEIVKKRDRANFQDQTLRWGSLLKMAREGNWTKIDEVLGLLNSQEQNEIVITSFIRTFHGCNDERKWPVLLRLLDHSSPLVRSSAALALEGNNTEETRSRLVKLCGDDYRIVRISAASALAGFSLDPVPANDKDLVAAATEEYRNSLVSRPDDWSAHYNMGIFNQNRGEITKALENYETSARLYPEALMPLINSSVLYSSLGNSAKAEENLNLALKYDPANEAANLNLGLLLAEKADFEGAKKAFLKALEKNPNQAVAAYNLSVIMSKTSIEEAVRFARLAVKSSGDEPKYKYTLAFYLAEKGQNAEAEKILVLLLKEKPEYLMATFLLGDILVREKKFGEARRIYENALKRNGISAEEKNAVMQAIQRLGSS